MADTVEKISAGKFGQEREKSRKVRTYCYHFRRSGSHLGKSATTKLRYEPKTTTDGGETGEADPLSCGARRDHRPLASDCRAVDHGGAASSSRPTCRS